MPNSPMLSTSPTLLTACPRRLGLIVSAVTLGCAIASPLTAVAVVAPSALASTSRQATVRTTVDGMTFEQAMRVGYAASRQGDLNTALINFRRALQIRPGHPYAAAAADNMAYLIQYERNSARQQAIREIEARLATATAQKDWVCAATTLDELTTYTAANSLNRERLIGQRGEVSGLLDARVDHERWSTVCGASTPVY